MHCKKIKLNPGNAIGKADYIYNILFASKFAAQTVTRKKIKNK